MKKLKTPQFKVSDLKVPPVVADVFYDLRDRRLLPLLALIVVAIFAVPIVLAGDSDETEGPVPGGAAAVPGASGSAAPAAQLTVVESTPGLRDYRKRLRGRTPTDPFEQKFSGPARSAQLNPQTTSTPESSSGGGSGESSSPVTDVTNFSGESTTTVTPAPSGDPGGGSGGGDSSGDDGGEPEGVLFTFAADIRLSRTEENEKGKQAMGEPTTREGVLPTTPLPGEKAPVVTYMGLGSARDKALLMVSNHVTSVFGDSKCLSGTDTCQLLEVETGFPQTFIYGENDVRYKVVVVKIEAAPVKGD